MKRTIVFLISLLFSLMLEPLLGPWQAQNRAGQAANTSTPRRADDNRPQPSLSVTLDEGSFVLTDLRLISVGGSTRMTGKLVNRTKRTWENLVFTVSAYDSAGRPLRGIERETIFGIHQLGKGKSASINSGYGVWLEGIPLNAIARLEAVLSDDKAQAAHSYEKVSSTEMEE
jgi:hypothetical protein